MPVAPIATTSALATGWAEPVATDPPIGIDDPSFAFTAPQIAAATRARISAKNGGAFYSYAPVPDIDGMHPILINETIILDGAANIGNLRFYAETGTPMIAITLEG